MPSHCPTAMVAAVLILSSLIRSLVPRPHMRHRWIDDHQSLERFTLAPANPFSAFGGNALIAFTLKLRH